MPRKIFRKKTTANSSPKREVKRLKKTSASAKKTTAKNSPTPYLVSDYIMDFLSDRGVNTVFLITGGAIAFVVDAFSRHKDMNYVCCAHEQGAAIMADAYSRLGPGLAATMVTSGPGATNLITGICCSQFDSIPAIHITGQVNTYEMIGADEGTEGVRQVGFQETDIVSITKPITKWAYQLRDPQKIRYVLEKAEYIAKSGRPGPVVLDIPMNMQRVEIDPSQLKGFEPPKEKPYADTGVALRNKVKQVVELMKDAKRPVLVAGGGVRLANAVDTFHEVAEKTQYPIVTSWSGYDSVPFDTPNYIGSHGVYGSRAANWAVQNSDLLITVGSRLDTRQTGGRPDTYARESKVVMVDIDKNELNKRRGLTPHLTIEADAQEFLTELSKALPSRERKPAEEWMSEFNAWIASHPQNNDLDAQQFVREMQKAMPLAELPDTSEWLARTADWWKRYPMVLQEYYDQKDYVNAYVFGKTLSEELDEGATIIPDDGGHLTWLMQSFEVKKGQRLFSAFGNSPMGYSFPASIGASVALDGGEVICIDGDGSFMMNMQELQTLKNLQLPVKIFIYNNSGYGIIRQFQDAYLDERHEATAEETGVTVPDYMKVAKAFDMKGIRISNHSELRAKIKQVLKEDGPVICEVMLDPDQKIMPKLVFGNPIEDMGPLVPREEFFEIMTVKPISRDENLTEAN